MSGRWSCATLQEGVRAVAHEAVKATPEAEEQRLLREIEDQVLHVSQSKCACMCVCVCKTTGLRKIECLCVCVCVFVFVFVFVCLS